jgi:hypothetical protein
MKHWYAIVLPAAVFLGLMGAPAICGAQAQESIEIGRLEVEDARQILGCFRTYLRTPGRRSAADDLRACVTSSNGRVETVTVPIIRKRVRCLSAAIRRVTLSLTRAEEHGVDDALDLARTELEMCAIEAPPPVTLASVSR